MTKSTTDTVHAITSRALVLPEENIDTDQIIPARFLTTTQREGLGASAFADWRLDTSGEPRVDCALNDERAAGCSVLVAGHNFGCGSSREHAPWALHDLGIRAVVSTAIADIFRANAAKNDIVPIVVPRDFHAELCSRPWCDVVVDVASGVISIDGHEACFPLDEFTRRCFLEGVDQLGYLLGHAQAINDFETRRDS